MLPFAEGTIARLDVMAASMALRVETTGRVWLCGHRVRYPSAAAGTTVALKTYALLPEGAPHALPATSTSTSVPPVRAVPFPTFRVSSTRQGVVLYNDRPPVEAGAK